jgi:hypothetical protein
MNPQDDKEEFEPGAHNPYRYEPRIRPSNLGRFSKFLLILGAILVLVGVVGGFSAMFFMKDGSNSPFMDLLMLAPAGFLMAFTGITGWVISGGK